MGLNFHKLHLKDKELEQVNVLHGKMFIKTRKRDEENSRHASKLQVVKC